MRIIVGISVGYVALPLSLAQSVGSLYRYNGYLCAKSPFASEFTEVISLFSEEIGWRTSPTLEGH